MILNLGSVLKFLRLYLYFQGTVYAKVKVKSVQALNHRWCFNQTDETITPKKLTKNNRRERVKFSVMKSGTLIHTHSGPTNCQLRAHLGLKVY